VSSRFILEHHGAIFTYLVDMLDPEANNYVTVLQSLRIIRELLLHFVDVAPLWTDQCRHLKAVMVLLRSKHRNIQTEALHVFILMVKDVGQRPRAFQEIILRNRDKLVAYLETCTAADNPSMPKMGPSTTQSTWDQQCLLRTIKTFELAPDNT
jgi:hypothetical protein